MPMHMKTYNFRITIEQNGDGIYVAKCPALPGCHTQAKSYDLVIKRMQEAISLCLEVLKKKREKLELIQPKFVAWQDLAVSV
ncbi:MAG: hypothetical protein UW45_C0020G0022 [Parcubacteria group bacterium GW2011_GWC2_44_22]|nr:MAG: hypothetical protein UW45_C0020G0022 [Parcubacteria group bacterium GW2011_GWC2_44_22]